VSRVESPSGKQYDDHYDDETIALLALGEQVEGPTPLTCAPVARADRG
jgi:hypothetical protein